MLNWPVLMKRATAAKCCDMTAVEFERAVANGALPSPRILNGRERWAMGRWENNSM